MCFLLVFLDILIDLKQVLMHIIIFLPMLVGVYYLTELYYLNESFLSFQNRKMYYLSECTTYYNKCPFRKLGPQTPLICTKLKKKRDWINHRFLRAPLELDKVFGCVEKLGTSSVDLACVLL